MPHDFVPRAPALALLLLLAPTATFAQEDVPAEAPARVADLQFGEDLGVRVDRLLEGVDAMETVTFRVPESWDVLEDPVLHLAFEHSSALLPERSHLTVAVNGHPLSTVPLDLANGSGGQLDVTLPRALLQPYNHVTLRAIQHVSHRCEEPFDPSLWTRIRKESTVVFPWAPRPVLPDLAALPFPFVEDTGYGPVALALVVGEQPSPATLAAAGRLGLAFGRWSPYRPVEVTSAAPDMARVRTHAVVVGLPHETPAIRLLLGEVGLKPSQGLVAMTSHPADPTLAVLVVTGADAEGLARATAAVTGEDRAAVLSGSRTLIDEALPSDPPPNRRMPRQAPPRPTYTFRDLGLEDQTVRGFSSAAIRVPLGLEGDAVVRPGGASARLEYGYAARLDPRLSAMEVRVDGVTIRTLPLDDPHGAARAVATVDLPDSLVHPDSELEVVFHTFPLDFDACQYLSDRTLWATVYASSELEVPRDRVAELPDLGRIRFDGWPFTLVPGEGEVVIAVADAPGPSDVAAGVQLAAWLGNRSRAASPTLTLAPASETSFAAHPDAHFVLLADTGAHELYDRVVRTGELVLTGDGARRLQDAERRLLLGVTPGAPYGTIEEVLSPAHPERAVLVLKAAARGALAPLVAALTSEPEARVLTGNVAVLGGDGRVRTLATATRHQVGSYAVGATLRVAVRRNWMLLGAGLIAGAFLLTAARRAWARTRDGQ